MALTDAQREQQIMERTLARIFGRKFDKAEDAGRFEGKNDRQVDRTKGRIASKTLDRRGSGITDRINRRIMNPSGPGVNNIGGGVNPSPLGSSLSSQGAPPLESNLGPLQSAAPSGNVFGGIPPLGGQQGAVGQPSLEA